jgi:hypothetical protein
VQKTQQLQGHRGEPELTMTRSPACNDASSLAQVCSKTCIFANDNSSIGSRVLADLGIGGLGQTYFENVLTVKASFSYKGC